MERLTIEFLILLAELLIKAAVRVMLLVAALIVVVIGGYIVVGVIKHLLDKYKARP